MKAITQAEFDRKKKIALETAPIRKVINTGDISVKGDKIFISNKEVQFSNNGIKRLAEILGIPTAFTNKYSSIFGGEGVNKLITHIATGLGSKNKKVMLMGSPTSKTIIDVKSAAHKYISTTSLLKIVEDTLNDNNDLIVSNFSVDPYGQLRVDTLNTVKHLNFGKNEDFFAGLNFTQSPSSGTQLSQYMFRQICTNGSFGKDDIKIMSGYDDDVVKALYSEIEKAAKDDFVPIGFGDRLKRASNTSASLSELRSAITHIDIESIDKFLPYNQIMHDLRGRRIDPNLLNAQQQRNCRIGCSVWDVINAMTDYASHDYGYGLSQEESRLIQVDASKILFKANFDTENLIER